MNLGSHHSATKALVRTLLANALTIPGLDWSLQGMGMLRLRLGSELRLHVWDSRYRAPGVSMVHDHQQWNLHSLIVAGQLANIRYVERGDGVPFLYRTLRAGFGCEFVDEEPSHILLAQQPREFYGEGDCYSQQADEIHETDAQDGTVTLMTQVRRESDRARVFWPAGRQWGSAEPRPATSAEIHPITSHALERWFA